MKKGQHQSLSKKKKEQSNKLQEKADKLEEIEKQNEERRKGLVKKMNHMDKKRKEYIKLKEEKIIEEKMRRSEKEKNVRNRLDEMNKEEYERRRDILDYQIDAVARNFKRTSNRSLRKYNSGNNSITNQIALQNHVTIFNKKLNVLKSQSVTKKPIEEKVKMYKEVKRKEAERKKKEKEEELFNKGQ